MPRKENQKLKLYSLYRILSEKTDDAHRLSMPELIGELAKKEICAERKSVYNDMELLREIGCDIVGEWKDGVYGYYMGLRRFELPELKLLVDSVQSARFITKRKSDELIKKLESLCSVYEAGSLQRQVYVQGRVKTMNEGIFANVDRIHEAIGANRQIGFRYWNWNAHKEQVLRKQGAEYRVSPWGLAWESENYYMIAYDGEAQKIKHYRVDKMTGIRLTGEKREGKAAFENINMAEYTRKTFGMFGGEERTVTLRCRDSLAGVMIDRFGKDVFLVPGTDGTFSLTTKVEVSSHFTGWLFSLGDGVKIVSPADVAEEFRRQAERIAEAYK